MSVFSRRVALLGGFKGKREDGCVVSLFGATGKSTNFEGRL